jgi:hypothetical protein
MAVGQTEEAKWGLKFTIRDEISEEKMALRCDLGV